MSERIHNLRERAASAGRAATDMFRVRASSLAAAPARRADARARAICPIDDWDFVPLYTDGSCPLCGWTPPGYAYRPPLLSRLDWFWVGLLAMAVVSAIMLIAVLRAYTAT